jgi:hypothetical protein
MLACVQQRLLVAAGQHWRVHGRHPRLDVPQGFAFFEHSSLKTASTEHAVHRANTSRATASLFFEYIVLYEAVSTFVEPEMQKSTKLCK